MKISFILAEHGANPTGGIKVVYEYASRLVARGHEVTVVHAPYRRRGERSFSKRARKLAAFVGRQWGLKGGYKPDAWFQIDPRVRMKWVPTLRAHWVPDADVVVATAWATAEWVNEYPERKGRKFYLIQGQESTFEGEDPARVMRTWVLPLKKIVVSGYLQNIAIKLDESATYIPNGLNFEDFGLDVPLSERDPQSLIMLYSTQKGKGSEQGLEAMYLVRQEVPGLRATLFGLPERPRALPHWISYWCRANTHLLRRLYNEAAIFVGPSWSEGWPLPPAEAAQCGAALCLTDIKGHREYAIHRQTALLSPPKLPEALATNIKNLIKDGDLRIRLALQGHEYVQQFTWNRAVKAFEEALQENVD